MKMWEDQEYRKTNRQSRMLKNAVQNWMAVKNDNSHNEVQLNKIRSKIVSKVWPAEYKSQNHYTFDNNDSMWSVSTMELSIKNNNHSLT